MESPQGGESAGASSPAVDAVLNEVLSELSGEIRKVAEALRVGSSKPPSALRNPNPPLEAATVLTTEERKALEDLLREPAFPNAPAAAETPGVPEGSFGEATAPPLVLPVPPPLTPSPMSLPPATVQAGAPPPAVEAAADTSIREVEDLIRMHMQKGAPLSPPPPPVASLLGGAERLLPELVEEAPTTWLDRLDRWIVERGMAPYKRWAAAAAWIILAATVAYAVWELLRRR